MPEAAQNTPADLDALLVKHQAAIDRIMANPAASAQEITALGLDPNAVANVQAKLVQLQQNAAAAGKKTVFATLGGFIAGFIGLFSLRRKVSEGKVKQGFFVALGSLVAGFLGGFLGGRFFRRKIETESQPLAEAWNNMLAQMAVALEKRENERATAQTLRTQETRKKLNGFFGQVAVDLGLMTPAQSDKMLAVKALFAAVNAAREAAKQPLLKTDQGWEKDPASAALLDEAQWEKIKADNKVDEETLKTILATITSGQGVATKMAPASGDIAVALGFIAPEAKNALLAAQAAERTLQSLSLTQHPDLAKVVNDRKWQRIGAAGDPAYLQSAQAINFLGAVLGSAFKQGEIKEGDDNGDAIANAQSALETLSINTFQDAAIALHQTSGYEGAANRIAHVVSDVAYKTGKGADMDTGKVTRALSILEVGLKSIEGQLAKQGVEWQQIQAKLDIAKKALEQQPAVGIAPPATPSLAPQQGNGRGR